MHQTTFDKLRKKEVLTQQIAMKKWDAIYGLLNEHNKDIPRGGYRREE